jgi:hypothetical protein
MPSATRLVFFSTLFALTNALPWSGAQPTAAYKPAAYVPRPTSTPELLPELLKRELLSPSTCGWIGGDVYSPVICAEGSKCVWDTANAIVDCCPNDGPCPGVITSCVDANSPPQTTSLVDVVTW